jgi:hypothetical protein
MGTWELWGGGGGEPYTNNSLFYCLTSFQFHKIEIFPWEHGNIGDILQKNSGADSKHKIVILSEACTKVLHPPKVLFLVQELFFFFFTCFACGGVPPMKCIISHKKHNPEPVPDFY